MKKLAWISIALIFNNILCLLLGDRMVASATNELELWTLHAANMYITQPPRNNTITKSTPLSDERQLITSNCTFFDVDPESMRSMNHFDNSQKSDDDQTNAQRPESKVIREATTLVELSPFLHPGTPNGVLSSPYDLSGLKDRAPLDAEGGTENENVHPFDGLANISRSFILTGRVYAGPFWEEIARDNSSTAPAIHEPFDGENNQPFLISFFAGENTGKLCFDLSLHDVNANVKNLSSALMVWSSPHCTTHISEFVEKELAIDNPETVFYKLSDTSEREGVEEDPVESSWLKACELSSVVRFDYRFTLSTALKAERRLCGYVDKQEQSDALSPSPEDRRRRIECSFIVAVRFRPPTKGLSEKERAKAAFKIAAVVTMPPANTSPNDPSGDLLLQSLSAIWGASKEEVALPAKPQAARLSDFNRFSNTSEGEGGESVVLQRCSDVSLSDQFSNLSSPFCTPSLGVYHKTVVKIEVDNEKGKTLLCVVLLFIFWLSVVSVIGSRFLVSKYQRKSSS